MKIIECVPNFSEGKNENTFSLMRDAVSKVKDVKLLSLEPDADYNRVVVTLAGNESGILEGALSICEAAAEQIDMRNHKGEHPRLGAIDVVPFVPVKNVSMDECVNIAQKFGDEASRRLNIPIYLYEFAAQSADRKNLANIRKGEYEGLKDKLVDPLWKPDFGQPIFNERLGAAVTGARFFLIAYNVNIKSTDVNFAKEIAEVLRESGRLKRDENGVVIKIDGKTVKEPGRLKEVKGMGVKLEKYNITQVSMNLTNYEISGMHTVFEEVKKEAERLGVEVNGSEIVGLVPLNALINSGKFYAPNSNDENYLVNIAIEKLGLNSLNEFLPKEKIIDYMV